MMMMMMIWYRVMNVFTMIVFSNFRDIFSVAVFLVRPTKSLNADKGCQKDFLTKDKEI
jgi:hypothetical protein